MTKPPKNGPASIVVSAPVIEMLRYLRTHPTTIAYPIAMNEIPITGMAPKKVPPGFFLSLNIFSNAPREPLFISLPSENSVTRPVVPKISTNIKYGIRKAAPPYLPTLHGNIQIFPIPMADPIQASINPAFDPNCSLLFSVLLLIIPPFN